MTSTGKINIHSLRPGDFFGRHNRYRITDDLAKTRMSRIYRATDTLSNRDVVIKFALNEAVRHFLINEAGILQKVNHPIFPEFYEIAEWKNTHYIAMEHITGTTLSILIRSRDIPFYRAIEIVMDICYGLDALHKAGYIHRDTNPANIILEDEKDPRLIDFGIGCKFSHQNSATYVGTFWYSSPEQFLGLPLGPRTDIFSLGLMLFEFIKGENPFKLILAQALQWPADDLPEATIFRELQIRANQPLPKLTRRDIERRIIPTEWEDLATQIDRTFMAFQQLYCKMTADRPKGVMELVPDLLKARDEAKKLASAELLDTKTSGVIDPRAIAPTFPESK